MRKWVVAAFAVVSIMATASLAQASTVVVVGGETRVSLDTDTLAAAAGLELAGVTPATNVVDGAVGFAINAREDVALGARPTTLSYDVNDPLGTLGGSIEHRGSVLFNDEAVIVGNFTIAPAEGGLFAVTDNVGTGLQLFDATPDLTTIVASNSRLFVEGDLQVSAAFADFLQEAGFAAADLTGASVGTFTTDAIVTPLPAGVVLAATGFAALGLVRHMQQRRRVADA